MRSKNEESIQAYRTTLENLRKDYTELLGAYEALTCKYVDLEVELISLRLKE